MGTNASSKSGTTGQDKALADMIEGLREETITGGATALMDEDLGSYGVPNPRILIVGCGGSGNNTLNRITHLGVEGAVTVAINTDKQTFRPYKSITKVACWPSYHSRIRCWR